MINGIRLLLLQFLCCLKSRADLQAENLMLRHQTGVLRRSSSKRVRTTRIDRLSFVWLYRLWPNSIGDVQIIHPKTLVRWHRQGFKAYWRWKSRSRVGRPKVSAELRALVLQISRQNPLWGAPRIHGELLKLGFNVSQATVSRYLPRRPRDPDQRWRTFLRNHRLLRGLDRLSRGSNRVVQIAVRSRRIEPSTPSTRSSLGYTEPDRGLDGSADAGSLPLG